MALITSINSVSVTPTHIKPGDSVTIAVSLTAGSRKLTGLQCALYGAIGSVNYLATPLVTKSVSIAANATSTVTFTTTASALNAQVDGRITAFAAGANSSIHNVPLLFGFRTVESNITSGSSVNSQEESASVGQFNYETDAGAGAFGKHYNPCIEALVIERARYDPGVNIFYPDDEGERALVTCVLSMDDPEDGQHFPCLLQWAGNTATICHSGASSIHNRTTGRWSYSDRAWFGSGMTRNIWPLFDFSFDTGSSYEITCVYGDEYESAALVFTLSAAFANVNLSGTGKGVAIGKFSASTVEQPLFEVASGYKSVFFGDAQFSGNVSVPADGLFKTITVSKSGNVSTGSATFSGTIAVDAGAGWEPVALVGFKISQTWCFVSQCQLTASGVEFAVRYRGSSSSNQSVTMTVNLLCVRTALPTS